ncbi:hypothetical protein GGR58DRAFT_526420 [Xylaria digitata]|nr:hypothetical protein GGR58DRAFT_526420 [Xylaria digitata]
MFSNGGYFCCESGQVGYALGDTDGCSFSGIALPADANPLAVINQVFSSTSTSTSSAPTSPSPLTPSSTSSSSTISSTPGTTTPGGTIVGAVIGGVAAIANIAGLLWFFLLKRKSSSTTTQPLPERYTSGSEENQYIGYYVMPTTGTSEIGGTPKSELSGVPERRELP